MNKRRYVILNITIVALVVALVICTVIYGINWYKKNRNEYEITKFIDSSYGDLISGSENVIEVHNEQQEKLMYSGYEVLGVLTIEKLDISYPILNSQESKAMDYSVIKFAADFVNGYGNITLAAHNNYDKTMFGRLHTLQYGDIVKITDNNGIDTTFSVIKIYRATPEDTAMIKSLDYSFRYVTLITCINGNKERLIVVAKETR